MVESESEQPRKLETRNASQDCIIEALKNQVNAPWSTSPYRTRIIKVWLVCRRRAVAAIITCIVSDSIGDIKEQISAALATKHAGFIGFLQTFGLLNCVAVPRAVHESMTTTLQSGLKFSVTSSIELTNVRKQLFSVFSQSSISFCITLPSYWCSSLRVTNNPLNLRTRFQFLQGT